MAFLRQLNVTFSVWYNCFCSSANTVFKRNLYQVLDVNPKASHVEIKEAYYKLSLLYHPDHNKNDFSSIKFREISEAYEILGNVVLRKKYDKSIIPAMPIYTGRSPRSEDHDYTKFYQSRKNSQAYKTKNASFNFDEFYKGHYGDQFANEDRLEKRESEKDTLEGAGFLFLVIFLLSAYLISATSDDDKVKRPPS